MISTTVIITFLFGAAFAYPKPHHIPGQPPRQPGAPFKLCVPESAYKPCLKMIDQGKSVGVHMTCVIARDRMDCIEKIENHSADWGAVDPEDMYVAAQYANKLFGVFKEIRTKEEPNSEFRYEAVAVIPKDLEINDLHQLKGLKSCHTGIGRNVGYKIPVTKLTKMGILPPFNNTSMSPLENELNTLSNFFSQACLVGEWSPNPETNARWKKQYSNLCQLCEFPDKCEYPDKYSGYDGALRCLTKGGGQVAWTKVIVVHQFFGMPYGSQPAKPVEDVNPEEYAYLCPDSSTKPLTGPPCTWAARPWEGYMANTEITDIKSELKELRDEISKLNDLGETTHADWITSVLELNAGKTLAVDNNGPYNPQKYLDKAGYNDVIERDVIKPARKVKLCVASKIEKEKCEHWSKAAYSRDIRPQIECVQKSSQKECFDAIKNKEADVVSIDPGFINHGESKDLEPIITEIYESKKANQHVVAIVKKGNSIQSLNDLKGKKVCLGETGTAAGWIIPIHVLKNTKGWNTNSCPLDKSLSEFFVSIQQTKNPLGCLISGQGDVAFVTSEELEWVKNNNENFKPDEYALLKMEESSCSIDKSDECHLATIPGHIVMANKDLSTVERDDVTYSVLSSGETFSEDPHIFLLFGNYKEQLNVIFSNYAKGFVTTSNKKVLSTISEFKNIISQYDSCPSTE